MSDDIHQSPILIQLQKRPTGLYIESSAADVKFYSPILSAYKKCAVFTTTKSADELKMTDILNNNHL